jgi:iron complex transport system substrate-binding protein
LPPYRSPSLCLRHGLTTAIVALSLLATPSKSSQAPLPSVVSTNLCADLLLLRMGAPGQIRSVSRQAQDPAQSPFAEVAADYPPNRGAVEELLYFQPDIALTYLGWSGRLHAGLLQEQGVRVVALPYPREIEDALAMTHDIAKVIDREGAGERAIADARVRIAALSNAAAGRNQPLRALYLRPNGGTAGSDTYVDALLGLLGLRNHAAEHGIRGWGKLPLERLLNDPPDLFLLGYFDQTQPQSKARYGRHPLFAQLLERVPTIRMPSSSAWGCGGLELIDAAEWIAARLQTLGPKGGPRLAR